MNASVSTKCGSEASADEGPSSSSDADNPPERAARHERRRRAPADVDIVCATDIEAGGFRVDADWIRDRLLDALSCVDSAVNTVCVRIVGDDRIRVLNRRHRESDETTDVLAFDNAASGAPIEADIVVNAAEASRRAGTLEHPIETELLLYALHGVLHCAGFEDGTSEGFAVMHAEEDRILQSIGVGPVFAGQPARGSARDHSGHDEGRRGGVRDGGSDR